MDGSHGIIPSPQLCQYMRLSHFSFYQTGRAGRAPSSKGLARGREPRRQWQRVSMSPPPDREPARGWHGHVASAAERRWRNASAMGVTTGQAWRRPSQRINGGVSSLGIAGGDVPVRPGLVFRIATLPAPAIPTSATDASYGCLSSCSLRASASRTLGSCLVLWPLDSRDDGARSSHARESLCNGVATRCPDCREGRVDATGNGIQVRVATDGRASPDSW